MPFATLTADGHLTLPDEIRQHLGLKGATTVRIEPGPAKTLIVSPESRSDAEESSAFGALSHLAKGSPVSLDEMNSAIKEGAASGFLGSRG